MTARKQFILMFMLLQIAGSLLVSAVAVVFLLQTLHQLLAASHNPILTVMEGRVVQKSILTFSVVAVLITALAIPVGAVLSRWFAAPYLRVLQRFAALARDRISSNVSVEFGRGDRELLEGYAATLIADMEKLKDFENARSWKEGARMLMHELKNPLTPLKLSAQQLAASRSKDAPQDADRLLASLGDIERILGIFKDLVNIEFGPKETIDAAGLIDEFILQARIPGRTITVRTKMTDGEFPVQAERTLVKMLLANLVNNSCEENPAECILAVVEDESSLRVEVLTPARTIADPTQVFRAGYSLKGKNRGYGLFLCRLISDYLDLGLHCANTDAGAVLSFAFKKIPPRTLAGGAQL